MLYVDMFACVYLVHVGVYWNVYVCVGVCFYVCVCVCISLCVSMHVCHVYNSVHVCMWYVHGCILVRVYICVHVSSCIWLHVTAITDSFVRSELGNKIFRLCSLWTDTLAIPRPTDERIQISVSVHTVKTRR